MRFVRLIFCVSFLLVASFGLAQQPQLTVNSYTLGQGDTLTLRASNLEPRASYTLTLTTPEGQSSTRTLRSDTKGEVRYEGPLQLTGDWTIALKGEDINAQLGVTVAENGLPPSVPAAEDSANSEPATRAEQNATEQNVVVEESLSTEQPITENETNTDTAASEETQTTRNNEVTAQESSTQEIITQENTTQQNNAEEVGETSNEETTIQQSETTAAESTQPGTTEAEPKTSEMGTSRAETVETETAQTETTQSEVTPSTQRTETPEAQPQSQTNQVEENQSATTTTEATNPATPITSPIRLRLENGILSGLSNGRNVWTLDFPNDSGRTSGFAEFNDVIFLGRGNSVLKIDRTTGTITQRYIVSGQVSELGGSREQLTVTAIVGEGLSETFTIQNDVLQETPRFGNQLEVLNWLRNEAQVENAQQRLEQDSTNPWLYVKVAETAESNEANALYREAVNSSQTFYDGAKLATILLNANQSDLANEAMNKALQDFAARGYDPRLLRDPTVMQSYGFPIAEFEEAIEQGDTAKADVYASWLRYFVSPDNAKINSLMRQYASILSQNGNRERAEEIRAYGEGAKVTRFDNVLGTLAHSLGNAGWYGVLSLGVAIVGLWFTLLFKYWSPHTLLNKRRQAAKKSVNPFSRLLSIRYYSFTEKVFLVLLFAAMLALAALASWNERGRTVAQNEAFSRGNLSSPAAQNALANLPENQSSSFIRGYAAHISGNAEAARTFYEGAGEFGPALNNLAVLTEDASLYQRAGDLPEAKANAGEKVALSPWQNFLVSNGEPLLVAPALTDLRAAAAGHWLDGLRTMFTNPWTGLQNARPTTITPVLWTVLQVLFLVLAIVTVLWLFVPRPKVAGNAPRNLLYHLFSLLIPGSGLADEMWGIALIVPWAVVSLDVLSDVLGWGLDIGITLDTGYIILVVIYLINFIAFIMELNSYRRRMRTLKQTNPDLAREYGLRVKTVGIN
ncbi:MAG: hypothetical protein ACRCYY_18565 [Trueperaceae bacterium]